LGGGMIINFYSLGHKNTTLPKESPGSFIKAGIHPKLVRAKEDVRRIGYG